MLKPDRPASQRLARLLTSKSPEGRVQYQDYQNLNFDVSLADRPGDPDHSLAPHEFPGDFLF